jgi:acetylornithine deacetylase
VASHLRQIGLDVEMQGGGPRDDANVIGVLEGRGTGRSLMRAVTWTRSASRACAAVRSRRARRPACTGRGAQDMKGGVAAMIDAARVIAQGTHGAPGGLPAGRLIVAAVVDEEYASIGADALITRWPRRRRRRHRADRSC